MIFALIHKRRTTERRNAQKKRKNERPQMDSWPSKDQRNKIDLECTFLLRLLNWSRISSCLRLIYVQETTTSKQTEYTRTWTRLNERTVKGGFYYQLLLFARLLHFSDTQFRIFSNYTQRDITTSFSSVVQSFKFIEFHRFLSLSLFFIHSIPLNIKY